MDYQPAVTEPQASLQPSSPVGEDSAVAFDQIIFTSLRGLRGQGYQVVSASRGISVEEKRVFGMWSPSHGGLSRETAHAVGMSFYQLPTGRFCLSRSWHAGMEPSGRGGLRVYTLGLIFDEAGLKAFSYNPVAILRVLGKVSAELRPPPHLPQRQLTPSDNGETLAAITRCNNEVDVEWLRHLLERGLDGDRLVVRCRRNPLELIETVLTALPGPLRGALSFCAEMKFSLGRQVQWTVSDVPQPNLGRLLRGQGITFVDLVGTLERPAPGGMIWAKMAETSWRNRAADDLLWLNEGPLAPVTEERLGPTAELMMRLLTARITDFNGLLALAADAADEHPEAENERGILDRFWGILEERLQREVERGGVLLLEHRTGEMIQLVRHRPKLLTQLGRLTVEMLTRWALEDPLAAGKAAVRWYEIPAMRKFDQWTAQLDEEIFTPLELCVDEADDSLRNELTQLLSQWGSVRGEESAGTSTQPN